MIAPALLGSTASLLAAAAVASVKAGDARARAGLAKPRGSAVRLEVGLLARPVLAGALGFASLGPAGAVAGIGALFVAERLASIRRLRAARVRQDEQLADAIGAVASAVRAGMSVPQAFAYAAGEAEEPLASELSRMVQDVHVGLPVGQAIQAWADRLGTEDARLLASVLELHRRAGGELTVILEQVGVTIRERVAAAREVRGLTAQARLSGLVLGLLPFGFFGFLWLTSRNEMRAALGTPAGVISVFLGLVLEALAFLWIRRLLAVA